MNLKKDFDKKQITLSIEKGCEGDPNTINLKLIEFNQEKTLVSLVRMIIINELHFVPNEGFRKSSRV